MLYPVSLGVVFSIEAVKKTAARYRFTYRQQNQRSLTRFELQPIRQSSVRVRV